MRATPALALVMLATLPLMQVHDAPQQTFQQQPLPKIAPAPEFSLTSQDGGQVTLADFRGKVVAVTFIYTLCTTTCPVLTPMMSFVQDQLGSNFGTKIAFVSITVDPERDTPQVFKEYAQASTPISRAGLSSPGPRTLFGTSRVATVCLRQRPRTATWTTRFLHPSWIRVESCGFSMSECASTRTSCAVIS